MKCKICHTNETDSTSGICWECFNNRYIRCPEYFTKDMTNNEDTLTLEKTNLVIEMFKK